MTTKPLFEFMKTTVIYHSADFDGIFCREIARKFLPDAELIGWDYGDDLLKFPTEGLVYILDLSPDCLEQLTVEHINEGRLIWIDHHKSAIEKYSKCNPQLPGYRIDGVAACRLAWQWFSKQCFTPAPDGIGAVLMGKQDFVDRKVSEPWAVRLAGEYDVWDKRDPDAELFQHGLRSEDLYSTTWEDMLQTGGSYTVMRLLNQGRAIQYATAHQNESIIKAAGFDIEFEGLKFLTPR